MVNAADRPENRDETELFERVPGPAGSPHFVAKQHVVVDENPAGILKIITG
jgi:hypothetical protein